MKLNRSPRRKHSYYCANLPTRILQSTCPRSPYPTTARVHRSVTAHHLNAPLAPLAFPQRLPSAQLTQGPPNKPHLHKRAHPPTTPAPPRTARIQPPRHLLYRCPPRFFTCASASASLILRPPPSLPKSAMSEGGVKPPRAPVVAEAHEVDTYHIPESFFA